MPTRLTSGSLGLEKLPLGSMSQGGIWQYNDHLEIDRILGAALEALDAFAAKLTSSLCERFHVSGAIDPHQGNAEAYDGYRFAKTNRAITDVFVMCDQTGSAGTQAVRFDVKVNNASIFSNNAFKPVMSASVGAGIAVASGQIASPNWPTGQALKVVVDSNTNGPGVPPLAGVSVLVYYKPSGSYQF